jgi:hypothetical protein
MMTNDQQRTYEGVLKEFVRIGAELIREDRGVRYSGFAPPGDRPLEPGFIPPDGPAMVTLVSYYPNESDLDQPGTAAYRRLRDHFAAWGNEGSVAAYRVAHDDWLESLDRIKFHLRWVKPILDGVGLPSSKIAWLPLIKVPLPAQTAPHDELIWADRMALWQQLSLLKPPVLWLQGAEAISRVKALCEDKFPHKIVEQKIPQYPKGDWMATERARLIDELLHALTD